jgi:L-ascorbate metabolism protein UlaG (beta-lactamase superfamily)
MVRLRSRLSFNWKHYAEWAVDRPHMLRLADRLGRGRGGARVFDHVNPPMPAPRRPVLAGWEAHELAAVWIGHATVLLRIGGLNVITDPVLSNRIGVGLGLVTGGPKRLVAPALSRRQLPRIDVILVSHAHFDHLDRPTLARLPKSAAVITSAHNGDLVRDLGFRRVHEVGWGEAIVHRGLTVTGWEARHWGSRTFFDSHRGFGGFLLEAGRRRVLYGGDTAYGEHYRGVGGVDLAILGIGAYDPWIQNHASPEQAWRMAGHAGAEFILPMHHRTFRLGREPLGEPMERLLEAAGPDAHRIATREIGEQWVFPG